MFIHFSMSRGGGGRGALMRKILELSSSCEGGNSDSINDSGLGDSKDKQLSSMDKSKPDSNESNILSQSGGGVPALIMGGRGRAKLLEMLTQQSSISTQLSSASSEDASFKKDELAHSSGKSKFIGRGKMFHEILDSQNGSIEKSESDLPESEMSNLNISEEKIEPDAVVKRGTKGHE